MAFYTLMHENNKVLTVDMDVYCNSVHFYRIINIENNNLLPFPCKQHTSNEANLLASLSNWFFSRFFDVNRAGFYELSNKLALYNNNRMFRIQYSNSFFTGAASLLDHYWFNPSEPMIIAPLTSDDEIKFQIRPMRWENLNFENRSFNSQVGDIMEDVMMNSRSRYSNPTELNLDSPNFTLSGSVMKTWVRINGKLYCKKIYEDSEDGIKRCEQQLRISDYLSALNSPFALKYNQDQEHPNICYSERFLGPNEEFLMCYHLLGAMPNADVSLENIRKIACRNGCKRRCITKYFRTIKKMKKDLNLEGKTYFENIGFIVDSKTGKIIRPAPIFGSTW